MRQATGKMSPIGDKTNFSHNQKRSLDSRLNIDEGAQNQTMATYLQIPLDPDTHKRASEISSVQPDLTTGKQAYLKALAIGAVQNYYQWQKINTYPTTDYLILPTGKHLYCLPVLPEQPQVTLPPLADSQGVGYALIGLKEKLDYGDFLGVIRGKDKNQEIEIKQLKPDDTLEMIAEVIRS